MDNYYETHMRSIADQLHEMLVVDDVIKFYKNIYYGNNDKAKKAFACMMFLADPQYDNPTEWVKKAIAEFNTKDVYKAIREEFNYSTEQKCFFVKVYRTIIKDKRKKKLEPIVTHEELTNKVLAMLSV